MRFGFVVAAMLLSAGATKGQDGSRQLDPQQTGNQVLGTAIETLIAEERPRQDLRRLVTSSQIARKYPDLAEYYRSESERLAAESKEYERFARAAGDSTSINEPNHNGLSRSARFDRLVAKDKLRRANDYKLLSALNRQAAQAEGCFACHSFHGRGGQIAPDLALQGTRQRSDKWLIAHFKDPRAQSPNSVMPAFGGLTASQLQVLSAFLQYQK